MPKDAPPNGGAPPEPVREDMFGRVSGMQTNFTVGLRPMRAAGSTTCLTLCMTRRR